MGALEEMAGKQRVFHMTEYMASEVAYNMKKIVLIADTDENKYAMRYVVNSDSLDICFSLYNTQTEVTVNKVLDVHQFSRICSNRATLEVYFNDLTYDMLEASQKRNTSKEIYL